MSGWDGKRFMHFTNRVNECGFVSELNYAEISKYNRDTKKTQQQTGDKW